MIRFGPRRSHPLIIFFNFFKNFGLLIALLAFCIIVGSFSALWNNVALPIVVLMGPLSRLYSYLFTTYTIDDKKLFIEKGLLNKQKIEIPLTTITSVDFTQSLIFQVMGVYMVNVENAASIRGNQTKVQFALKSETALDAKALLMGRKTRNAGEGSTHSTVPMGDDAAYPTADVFHRQDDDNEKILSRRAATIGELIMMGLLQSKGLMMFQVLSGAAVVITFGSQLFFHESVDGQQYIFEWFQKLDGIRLVLLVLAALYLVGIVAGVLLSTLKYFGFVITNRSDSIFVEYGLLTRKTHTIMKDKISGISFKQSFLMDRIHMGMVYVFVAGFSLEEDNAPKDALLFPLMRQKELIGFLKGHVPEVEVPEVYTKPETRALPYFFLCPRFLLAVVLFASTLAVVLVPAAHGISLPFKDSLWMLGLVLLLFTAASVAMEYRHTGIHADASQVSLVSGGFTKNRVFLRIGSVESVRERATLTKKNKNMTHVLVSIIAVPQYANHRVRNVSLDSFRHLASCLRY